MYNTANDEWEFYIGQLYANIIKSKNIDINGSVIELAPGFRYKTAYALKEINFCGDLYIIDESQDVLDYIDLKYKELLPFANIHCIHSKFKNSLNLIPDDAELFIANHVLDDLIIFNYIKNYNSEKDFYYEISAQWNILINKSNEYNFIIDTIINTFKNIKNKNIKHYIISQYNSNLYVNNNANYITQQCFDALKTMFNQNTNINQHLLNYHPFGNDKRYLIESLLNNVQNAKNWIII